MHPECPDYDLCENCEAFPIAVHPSNHPMLKMKTPDTVIPTVYRIGQTSVIEPTTVVDEHQTSIDTSRLPVYPFRHCSKGPEPSAAPMVPGNANIPPQTAHASSSSPVEDEMMRSCTPVARSFFDHVDVSENGEAPLNQAEQRSVPSPGPPKLPPKPAMFSRPPWATVPDTFNAAPRPQYAPQHVQSNTFLPLSDQNTDANNQMSFGTVRRPQDAEPPIPAMPPTPPPPHLLESLPAPQVPEDNERLVWDTNPWPTTNETEKEELLKLIYEFSGPFVRVPASSPGLADSVSINKPFEQSAATPPRNSPLLTPPLTTVDLSRAIPSLVERPSTLESQESRPSANDPLPSWASLTPDVNQLMRENLEASTERKPASITSEPPSAVGSPLSSQALLKRPASGSPAYLRSLNELVHQLPSLVPSKIPSLDKLSEGHGALSAKFVEDVTVADGQTFPPGAEFVKCWRLFNSGERDWPENTELVFVAGDPLSVSALPPVLIGRVAAGTEYDVWTGELKVCLIIYSLNITYHKYYRHLTHLDDMLGTGE